MKRYLIGLMVPMALCAIVAVLVPRSGWWGLSGPAGAVRVLLTLVALPMLMAWACAEIVHFVRPRRLFLGRRRSTAVLLAGGCAAGLMTLALIGVGLAFADRWIADGVIVAGAAFIAALAGVIAFPRHRPGYCVECRYDLRASSLTSAGRCTECGAQVWARP